MIKAYEYAYRNSNCYDVYVPVAAYMHDCGKVYTKGYFDSKGEPCSTAHYYEHHNVSAYMSLFYLKDLFKEDNIDFQFSDDDILYMSLLVNLHMRPLLAWIQSNKAKEKDRGLFGDSVISDIEAINRADKAAH
jgi:CRISPR/Cas system-associated endonuclease Cas3-HD